MAISATIGVFVKGMGGSAFTAKLKSASCALSLFMVVGLSLVLARIGISYACSIIGAGAKAFWPAGPAQAKFHKQARLGRPALTFWAAGRGILQAFSIKRPGTRAL